MSAVNVEESELLNDSKYRSYVSQVERALKAFESTSEWADLISSLGKLNKVLSTNIKYPVIPRRVTIGKRLAQCLHPALPSGVHLKVLETYDIIFKCIGTQRLAADLFTYGAGLFPLLGYAAMNVRPSLLSLYEAHFVALRQHIKPALTGLIMGLLPGLEDGSEHSVKTAHLLEDFCDGVEPAFFYGSLWECVLSSPSNRLAAINYVLAHFNRKQSLEDQIYIIGTNINVLVESLSASLLDNNVLVQRSTLDLLLCAFPMHCNQLPRSDTVSLVTAAINVVLRRDSSLNRRLYAWLIGTDSNGLPIVSNNHDAPGTDSSAMPIERQSSLNSDADLHYFETNSKSFLIQAVRNSLHDDTDGMRDSANRLASVSLRPFKILMILLDKQEIGSAILEDIFLDMLRCMHRECIVKAVTKTPSKDSDQTSAIGEIVKTANLLLGGMEPSFIWQFIGKTLESACQDATKVVPNPRALLNDTSAVTVSVRELCDIVNFLLEKLSMEAYKETQTTHLPCLLLDVIQSLIAHVDHLDDIELVSCLRLASKILVNVQPALTVVSTLSSSPRRRIKQHHHNQHVINGSSTDTQHLTDTSDKEGDNSEMSDEYSASDGYYNKPAYAEYDSFCEFVQFEAGNSDSSKTEVVVETIMQKCIRNYLEFFTKFVDVHMSKSVELFLREFVNPTCSHVEGEDRTGLKENGETENNHGSSSVGCLPTVSRLCPIKASKDIIEAFNVACQLLIDMSALPLGHPNHSVTPSNKSGDSKVMFPQWLQRLLLSACAINQVDIEMCAVSTLLDLIVLTQSAFVSQHPSHVDQLSTTGAVRVIMKPLLTVSDLSSLGSSTNFFELVATNLWNFLDERTPDCHTRAVSLLYQLHQLSPDPWTCENVISSALLSNDKAMRINAHCRFAVLWHLLRDRMTSATLISNDKPSMFDRSLLVMLDSLQRSRGDHLCSDVTQTWLLQVVERGDLIRVLEPVLILLLHPDTARVSIQHVVVHKLCHLRNVHHHGESQATDVTNATNADDTKIFAISSEGGNVIYHVSSSSKTIRCKRSTDELQAYATLMSMTGQSSSRAVHSLLSDVAADSNLLISGVTTGEFDAESSSNADVLNTKLLSRVHEGTFFDDNQCTVNGDVFNVEVFAKQIIDELIERAVNGDLATAVGDSAKDDTDDDTHQGPAMKNADKRQQNGFVLETNDASSAAVVHPLYAHILLYTHKFDTQRAIYAFDRLTAILQTSPRLVVRALTTSNVGGTGTPRSPLLQSLLAQHRRAVIGHRFHGDDVESAAAATGIRSSMFVEVLIMVSQYYLRAQYPNLLGASLERSDLNDNVQLQIMAVDILVIVLGELGNIARSGGRGFATYIVDLLDKCKVQKTVIHTLVASVHSSRCRANVVDNIVDISEAIVMFNDVPGSLSSTTLQSHLLHLMLAIIQLEYQLTASRTEPSSQAGLLPSEWDKFDASTPLTSTNVKFLPNRPVVQQPMLLLSITSALRQQHTCNLHRHWLGFVVSLLPFLGRTLPRYVTATVLQISRNLELLAPFYEFSHSCKAKSAPLTKMPPDHAVMLLDGLSTIFQYCLTDSSSQQEFGHGFNHTGSGTANNTNLDGGLLSSLASVFHLTNSREVTPNRDESSSFSPRLEARTALLKMLSRVLASLTVLWKAVHMSEGRTEYRHSVQQSCWILGSPKIVQPCLLGLIWSSILAGLQPSRIVVQPKMVQYACYKTLSKRVLNGLGQSQLCRKTVIRQCVLDWVSPLALNHCVHLLAAVAGVWNERRQRSSATKRAVPVSSADQLILVDIISAIKLLSLESVMQTVRLIIKQPPQLSSLSTGSTVKNVPVEVGLLRFLYAYIQRVDNSALDECWPLLLLLLRDTLQVCLSPPVIFILLNILHEFLQKIPMFEERKDQKDLQEVTQKLFESCAQVAGSSLEQTTFFRRNLAVKPGPQLDVASEVEEGIANGDVDGSRLSSPVIMDSTARSPTDSTADYRQYSVQALQLLAEVTITLLDVVYRSDEKERVIPLLSTILGNVFPYLKNHMMHNLPSYRACSQMLSNLSSYQYTRRAWKREVFELMMETNFFQMDAKCIASWRILIDNLMTHDRTTFKDLLVRVNLTQSSSLNLFISREAEYEQRAQLLKRLSFVIFCSEIDQYQRQMPEIQEKLADCLRMPAALPVQAQVFLCFRVLILRVSAQHLTSLWPTIITELVHVMLQLEQELTPECDVDLNGSSRLQSKNRSQTSKQSSAEVSLMNANSSADVSGTTLSPSWLSLFMAACKLLDLALVLPADFLPQFQLYRWAFTGDCGVPASESDRRRLRDQPPTFVPHVVRIGRRISAKFGDVPLLPRQPHRPLLAPNRTPTVEDVCSFFVTLNVALHESSSVSGVIPSNRLTPSQTGNWLPRAHSAPNISQSHESSVLWTTDSLEDTKLQPMDFIEQLVLKDFTEQMQSL